MDSEIGTLIVILLKARNLNDKHSFRKQDVFAQATLNDVQKRSHVDIRGGQHPVWDSEIRFTVLKGDGTEGKNRKLEVACYAQEHKREDLLGNATVNITDTLKTGEFDDWVSLSVDGVVRGDIYLEMTYYANASAPAAALNNKPLASVQGSAFGRRPSKLSPSNRLSRPIQKNTAGPSRSSPMQPPRLRDQSNSPVPPVKDGPLSALLSDEPVHSSAAIPSTHLPPLSTSSQVSVLPSILRPGSGGRPSPIPIPVTHPHQQRNSGHNRTLSDSSISPSNSLHNTTVSLSPPNPYIVSSTYIPAHSGSSNIDDPLSSDPYTGNSSAYMDGQPHQQASGALMYSPAPPGVFIPENQPGPERSYSPVSHVQTSGPSNLDSDPNPYTESSGALIPMGQRQASGRRVYSPVPPTVSGQVSASHPAVPISVSPSTPHCRNSGIYSPENQLGPNVLSPAPPPVSVQTSRLPNIHHSPPADPYTGGGGEFGSQRASDGRTYLSASPFTAQTSGYPNYVTSLQTLSSLSLPYNKGTGASSVSSGPLTFPMPAVPVVVEPYEYHEPSSYARANLGGNSHYQPPPQTTSVSSSRSAKEHDPYHFARYQTPLPLPPEFVKESPLPRPPPAPTMSLPAQISSSPPPVSPAPAPDTTRIEALRKAEQDAAWRRQQELKDLELAMQLDRELNL